MLYVMCLFAGIGIGVVIMCLAFMGKTPTVTEEVEGPKQ